MIWIGLRPAGAVGIRWDITINSFEQIRWSWYQYPPSLAFTPNVFVGVGVGYTSILYPVRWKTVLRFATAHQAFHPYVKSATFLLVLYIAYNSLVPAYHSGLGCRLSSWGFRKYLIKSAAIRHTNFDIPSTIYTDHNNTEDERSLYSSRIYIRGRIIIINYRTL